MGYHFGDIWIGIKIKELSVENILIMTGDCR